MKQPEALRLADYLDDLFDADGQPKQAAAELRRLEAVNKELTAKLAEQPAQQEPVAIEHCLWARNGNAPCPHTAPQPSQRKPLTEEQILADETLRYCFGLNGGAGPVSEKGRKVVDVIEAAHGIKENT